MRIYYGWLIVCLAALAMVGTLPGRSQGLGLITEPLLVDLHLDRVTYASINFWATIAGALGAIGVGRLLDRFGARMVLTAVALMLSAGVVAMSRAGTIAGLVVSLAATRALGQGALSVISIAMVGHWFKRRINAAMATYSIVLSIGFMIAFPLVGSLVQQWGWRRAWLAIAIGLAAGLAPLSWLVGRRSPESIGLQIDGSKTIEGQQASQRRELDPGAAAIDAGVAPAEATPFGFLLTGAFWVFAIGTALYGLVASGIGLFNESILAERGFNHDVYYQTLAVTAITALAGNFFGGWLMSRVSLTRLMSAALLMLAAGVGVLPQLATLAAVMAWAAMMGLAGGVVMVLFFSVWPAVFGRRHLGQIQGIAQALTVLASAIGPLLLAKCVEATGSYAAMFRILAGVVAFVAAASFAVPLPAPRPVINHT